MRALLRDEKRDVRCKRERGTIRGRRRAEHASAEDKLGRRARFRGGFLRGLLHNCDDQLMSTVFDDNNIDAKTHRSAR